MGRKPVFEEDANGDVSIRLRVPRPMWLVAKQLAEQYEIRADKALGVLLSKLAYAFADHKRVPEEVGRIFGFDVVEALTKARAANFGVIASGPTINVEQLHRSPKLKSGFVGVYPSGKGYRTEARTNVGGQRKHLGTFDTAEQAAWIRFLYYQQHDLPYGVWEEAIDERRAKGKMESDAYLIHDFESANELCGLEHLNQMPGRPKNPNQVPLGSTIDLAGPGSLEELRAANAARDEQLRQETKKRIQAANQQALNDDD